MCTRVNVYVCVFVHIFIYAVSIYVRMYVYACARVSVCEYIYICMHKLIFNKYIKTKSCLLAFNDGIKMLIY